VRLDAFSAALGHLAASRPKPTMNILPSVQEGRPQVSTAGGRTDGENSPTSCAQPARVSGPCKGPRTWRGSHRHGQGKNMTVDQIAVLGLVASTKEKLPIWPELSPRQRGAGLILTPCRCEDDKALPLKTQPPARAAPPASCQNHFGSASIPRT